MPKPNLPDQERCTYTTGTGRRCRNGRMSGSVSLCHHHWNSQEETRKREAERAQEEEKLSTVSRQLFRERLDSADSVTQFLGRVARRVAGGKLPPRIGTSLGYIGQVILSAVVQRERLRAIAEAAAAEAAEAAASDAHPLLRKIDHIDEILKSLEQHTAPEAHSTSQLHQGNSSEAHHESTSPESRVTNH